MLRSSRITPARNRPIPFYISEEDAASKQEILKAALHLFVYKGMCETSIRDIAEASGYTNPALFKFFEGKEALTLYLFERCYEHLSDAFSEAIKPDCEFRDAVRSLLARYARILDEVPETFLFVQDNLRHLWPKVSMRVRRKSLVAKFRRLLEQGQASGAVSEDLPVNLLVAAFSGLVTQFARMRYFGEFRGSAAEWVNAVEQIALRMLSPLST